MDRSSILKKHIKYGSIGVAMFLFLYMLFSLTGKVYFQYSAASDSAAIEKFLVTYDPNVCSRDERTIFCKDYEFQVYTILDRYISSKSYLRIQKRREIFASLHEVTDAHQTSLLGILIAGFPKDTFKEEMSGLSK